MRHSPVNTCPVVGKQSASTSQNPAENPRKRLSQSQVSQATLLGQFASCLKWMSTLVGRGVSVRVRKRRNSYVLQRQQNKSNDSNQKLKMLQNNEDYSHLKYHYYLLSINIVNSLEYNIHNLHSICMPILSRI